MLNPGNVEWQDRSFCETGGAAATAQGLLGKAALGHRVCVFQNPASGRAYDRSAPAGLTGMRWHVRAYCEKNRDYRDFVLGRCRGEPELLDDQTDNGSEHDVEWNTKINVIFKLDERLTPAQRSLIELNYAMTDGAVGCRKLSSGGEVGSETVSRKPEFAWRTASSSAISVGEPG